MASVWDLERRLLICSLLLSGLQILLQSGEKKIYISINAVLTTFEDVYLVVVPVPSM